jgi:transglutaminase-like putative cysteine protease
MNRRLFLKSTGAATLASALPWHAALGAEGWRTYEITSRVEVLAPRGASRAWIPLPMSDETSWHKAVGNAWGGNATQARILNDGKYGVGMLYAEWSSGQAMPVIEVTSGFMTRERADVLSRPDPNVRRLSAEEVAFYTAPTELIPTDGIVRETARDVTKGARGDVEKARAIYEWVVDNTHRDPKTRGCGWGDIKSMLESGNLGGKCGDLNAMFVGLARAAGVPARDVYGLRVAPSKYGYKSLGTGSPNVTRAQHCRAEFFARGYGWVPVDPADVRKVILEEPPGNLPVGDAKVAAARKRLFGGWEMNWLAYNMGHDVVLPGANGAKVPYLMYINAQTGGEMRDQLDPDGVKYTITSREV